MTPNPELPRSSPAFTRQHKLVAFGVYAHCEMRRFTAFRLGFATQTAAAGHNFPRSGKHIRHLKAQPSPCSPTFPSAVNSDRRTAYNHLAHNIRFSHDIAVEDIPVKPQRSLQVNSPDDVLHALHVHVMIFLSPFTVRRSPFGVHGSVFCLLSSAFYGRDGLCAVRLTRFQFE